MYKKLTNHFRSAKFTMVKVLANLKMATPIKVKSATVYLMGKVLLLGQMELNIKENFEKTRLLAKVSTFGLMEVLTRGKC